MSEELQAGGDVAANSQGSDSDNSFDRVGSDSALTSPVTAIPTATTATTNSNNNDDAQPAAATTNKKKQKPLIEVHHNGADLLLGAPAFGALWLTHEHVVVGGGGGGRRHELPNSVVLTHVPSGAHRGEMNGLHENPSASEWPVSDIARVLAGIDFEDAGTVQMISEGFSRRENDIFFVVTHVDAFTLMRCHFSDDGEGATPTLKALCRIALVKDALDPDTKPAVIVGTGVDGDSVNDDLLFVAQDNMTVAVYKMSSLVAWAEKQESQQQQRPPIKDSSCVYAIVASPEDSRREGLVHAEFECGGRLCDLKAKHLAMFDEVAAARNSSTGNSASSTIVLSLCCRDKVLRIGTFNPSAGGRGGDFVPHGMFSATEMGFDPATTTTTGQSVRCSSFAEPVTQVFASDNGRWIGNALDLFVAVCPRGGPINVVRVSVRAVLGSSGNKSLIKTDVVCKTASRVFGDAPGCITVLPSEALGDAQTGGESVVAVGTCEGALIEFVFNNGQKHNTSIASGCSPCRGGGSGKVRRFIENFHSNGVTSIALPSSSISPAKGRDGRAWKTTRLAVSTDLGHKIAFHTWDPTSRDVFLQQPDSSRSSNDKADGGSVAAAPDLFLQRVSPEAQKKMKMMVPQLVFLSVVGCVVCFIVSFILSFFF